MSARIETSLLEQLGRLLEEEKSLTAFGSSLDPAQRGRLLEVAKALDAAQLLLHRRKSKSPEDYQI